MDWLPSARPPLGVKRATLTCVLARNRTVPSSSWFLGRCSIPEPPGLGRTFLLKLRDQRCLISSRRYPALLRQGSDLFSFQTNGLLGRPCAPGAAVSLSAFRRSEARASWLCWKMERGSYFFYSRGPGGSSVCQERTSNSGHEAVLC